jgi:hypothetical protein
MFRVLLLAALLPATALAQKPKTAKPAAQQPAEDPVLLADIQSFEQWLQGYKAGQFRLMKDDQLDEAAIAKVGEQMAQMAKWNTLAAAKKLLEAASWDPTPQKAQTAAEIADFHRELQPFRVQALAVQHLRTMTGPGILGWLLGIINNKAVFAAGKNQEQRNAAIALRVLGGQPGVEAKLELLKACSTMPTELRVRAVAALADDATLETVPSLLDMLADVEPNVRIAAATGISHALAPHVDESLGKKPEAPVLQTRDQVIERLRQLLLKDPVWQVRSAAAFGLAGLKCKPVVPALIDGLEAELIRKKDPWAMDVRLHRLLEGLTDQHVLLGDIRLWREFWKKEGPLFTVKPKTAPGKPAPQSDKYRKFFDLDIQSDRVLFVVDFSGSMAEPITLKNPGTVTKAGATTTKAKLVVAELKKLIMSLPDGALVNFVVFSDEVRLWREDHGRPSLVKLDDMSRDDLVGTFLDSLLPQGGTNIYGALDKGLEFAGRGLYDKYYAAAFDTIYVITDGAPSVGEVIDKDEIRRRVREANKLRKLAIHCVTFGEKNDTDFLRLLAEENGGRHIHIE